jgi:hypothetical protein
MMLYVSKNGNFKNNTIPFFAERLEHLEGYLSNFIRFCALLHYLHQHLLRQLLLLTMLLQALQPA